MDSVEAKEILALYRPGDTNPPDPRMAQALELARQDPQLAAWFGQHCAAHVKLPEPELPKPPPAPKEQKPAPEERQEDVGILPLNKAALVMIGAAVFVLLAAFAWSYLPKPHQNSYASYRDRMARLVQRGYPMKTALTDQAQLRDYFRANAGFVDFSLPGKLEKLPGKGGAVFTWNNQPVTLLGLDGGPNTNFYLFLIKRSVFPNPPPPTKPEFVQVGRLMTATWTQGENIYLLAGPPDQAVLENYIE